MLAINTLNLLQAVEHGFPPKPSAIAHDPELNLLAIGTSNGLLKMYPLVVNMRSTFGCSLPPFSVPDNSYVFVLEEFCNIFKGQLLAPKNPEIWGHFCELATVKLKTSAPRQQVVDHDLIKSDLGMPRTL